MLILSFILLAVAGIVGLASAIWMLVAAFRHSLSWGVAVLAADFVSVGAAVMPLEARMHYHPLLLALRVAQIAVYISFLVVAWPEAKDPFFWWLSSVLLGVMGVFLLIGADPARLQKFTDEMQKRGVHVPYFSDNKQRSGSGSTSTPLSWPWSRSTPTPERVPTPPPIKPGEVFRSKLPPAITTPGQPELAPPGFYYLLQRVTAKNGTGFRAANVGEKVVLMKRLANDKMLINVDGAEFVVHKSQLTDDLSVAREAEREDWVLRGGKL